MIFTNPTDKVLQTAHEIVLLDKASKWSESVLSLIERRPGITYLKVEIPVDSKDTTAVQSWRDKIKAARR